MIILLVIAIIGSYVIGSYFGFKDGFKTGLIYGAKEEQLLMGVSIARTFKENHEEVLKDISIQYKQLSLELEESMKNRDV